MIDDVKAGSSADNLEMQLTGDSVPEKFRGKTVKDVLNSYSELQTAHSRQGQEVGELRRLAANLSELEVRTSKKDEPARQPIETDDLLTDPDKAINEAIETHPVVKQARETAEQLERQLAVNSFEKKHPSFREDVTDPKFKEWVESSPGLGSLAAAADRYDMGAADTLFTLWEERKMLLDQASKKEADRENKAKKEREGTLEGSSGADASSEVVLSRLELRELHRKALLGNREAMAKWSDPKFQAMRRKAYQDGRVS